MLGDLDRIVVPGLSHWQHPALLRLLPLPTATLSSVLGDYVSTGLGVLGPGLAVEPGADRGRGGRRPTGCARWWASPARGAASSRTPRRPARCVALICARERATGLRLARGGLQAEPRAAGRLRLGAQPQLGGQGGAAGRLRPREHAPRRPRRATTPCAPTRSRQAIARRPRGRPRARARSSPPPARPRPRRSIRSRRSPRSRSEHGALAARRRGHGRLGDDPARVPLDVGGHRGRRLARASTRTSGWARRSTARSTSCATPSTWCA